MISDRRYVIAHRSTRLKQPPRPNKLSLHDLSVTYVRSAARYFMQANAQANQIAGLEQGLPLPPTVYRHSVTSAVHWALASLVVLIWLESEAGATCFALVQVNLRNILGRRSDHQGSGAEDSATSLAVCVADHYERSSHGNRTVRCKMGQKDIGCLSQAGQTTSSAHSKFPGNV